jgi:hypothetical protein
MKTLEKTQVEEIATLIHSLTTSLWEGVSNLEIDMYGKKLTINIKQLSLIVSGQDTFEIGYYGMIWKPLCDTSKWLKKFVEDEVILDNSSLKNVAPSYLWDKDLKTLNQYFSKNKFLEKNIDYIHGLYYDYSGEKANSFDKKQFVQEVMNVYQEYIDEETKQTKTVIYKGVKFTKKELENLLETEYTN